MFDFQPDPAQPKPEMYRELVESARALTHGEHATPREPANCAQAVRGTRHNGNCVAS